MSVLQWVGEPVGSGLEFETHSVQKSTPLINKKASDERPSFDDDYNEYLKDHDCCGILISSVLKWCAREYQGWQYVWEKGWTAEYNEEEVDVFEIWFMRAVIFGRPWRRTSRNTPHQRKSYALALKAEKVDGTKDSSPEGLDRNYLKSTAPVPALILCLTILTTVGTKNKVLPTSKCPNQPKCRPCAGRWREKRIQMASWRWWVRSDEKLGDRRKAQEFHRKMRWFRESLRYSWVA